MASALGTGTIKFPLETGSCSINSNSSSTVTIAFTPRVRETDQERFTRGCSILIFQVLSKNEVQEIWSAAGCAWQASLRKKPSQKARPVTAHEPQCFQSCICTRFLMSSWTKLASVIFHLKSTKMQISHSRQNLCDLWILL